MDRDSKEVRWDCRSSCLAKFFKLCTVNQHLTSTDQIESDGLIERALIESDGLLSNLLGEIDTMLVVVKRQLNINSIVMKHLLRLW